MKIKLQLSQILVLITLCMNTNMALATPKAQGIRSCYQSGEIGDQDANYTFLSGTFYQFFYTGVSKVDYWHFELWDWEGAGLVVDFDAMGLLRNGHHKYLDMVSAKYYDNEVYHYNTNLFYLGDSVKSLTITPVAISGGVYSYGARIHIDLKTPQEAFTFESIDDNCFTFDDFSVVYSTILDNLCHPPDARLKSVPPSLPGWQLYNEAVDWGSSRTIPTPENFCPDECTGATAPYTTPDPVPCGCIPFELEITLYPCDEMPQVEPPQAFACPPLTFTVPIEICCECDVRENPPAN